MMVAGADALHLAGTVQVQVDGIQFGKVLPHGLQNGGLNVLESGALHHAVGTGIGVQRRYKGHIRAVKYITQLQVRDAVLPKVQADIVEVALFGDVLVGLLKKACN